MSPLCFFLSGNMLPLYSTSSVEKQADTAFIQVDLPVEAPPTIHNVLFLKSLGKRVKYVIKRKLVYPDAQICLKQVSVSR